MSTHIKTFALFFAVCISGMHACAEDRDSIYAFLVECSIQDGQGGSYLQSFVAEVPNGNLASEVRKILSGEAPYRLAVFEIGNGPGGVLVANKNFHTANSKPWSWRVLRLVELLDISKIRLPASNPVYASSPADIEKDPASWIVANGNQYAPLSGKFAMEFGRDRMPAKMINISNRGVSGSGDRVLIAGFIIEGSEPRRVVIRGLGPSLSQFGVRKVIADPAVRLFSGATQIAFNENWKVGQSMLPFLEIPPSLTVNLNDLEAALVLTLPPGPYTAHLESPTEAIGLLEVYDVTAP